MDPFRNELDPNLRRTLPGKPVHHLANIGQASSALGVFGGTVAAACPPLRLDLLQDGGTAVDLPVTSNVFRGIVETIAYRFSHA
jgi:hypothetical protein